MELHTAGVTVAAASSLRSESGALSYPGVPGHGHLPVSLASLNGQFANAGASQRAFYQRTVQGRGRMPVPLST